MRILDIRRAAADAPAPNASRPATAIVHDSADARLVVFRLAPGQSVPPHRSVSTVTLTAISGRGFARGAADECALAPGETVIFEPNELHGMRAEDEELVLLATITPRPGARSTVASDAHVLARAAVANSGAEEL
jgi:quercetin dioxygenase-like cupin family protein